MFTRIKLSVLLIYCLTCLTAFGQKQVRGHLKTRDSIEFSIINVLPDSFPTISIILKGHKANGDPLWNLKKEDFMVTEDGEDSNVKSLIPISRNKPINIGIVLDHSQSMLEDYSLLYDKNGYELFSYDTNTFELILPKGYVSPIDNGKATTKEFASSFNFKKDFISIVGFSSTVDKILPLTNNKEKIDSIINSMQADSLTALYDAMLAGLNQLNTSYGVNVLVTLTDGQNNKSKSSWKDVTERAAHLEIPIYIIGLGNVNKDTLQMIADMTNGQFIYTQTSESFRQIYSRISKDIQSFYDLKYESHNLSAIESKRRLTITFLPNDIKSDTLNYDFVLPDEVKAYLKNRVKRLDYIIGISIVSAITLTIGTIVYRRRRRKNASR
jgi:Ca-activated chloride channel family protein